MNTNKAVFIKEITSPLKFYFFKWFKLPSLAFWGVKIDQLTEEHCIVKLNQSWTNKNPFGSVYFSALLGTAELSTGVLVLMNVYKQNFSMLVVATKANFTKKARGKLRFICKEGAYVNQCLSELAEGESTMFDLHSIAYDEAGDEVGNFVFTWSVKRK